MRREGEAGKSTPQQEKGRECYQGDTEVELTGEDHSGELSSDEDQTL